MLVTHSAGQRPTHKRISDHVYTYVEEDGRPEELAVGAESIDHKEVGSLS